MMQRVWINRAITSSLLACLFGVAMSSAIAQQRSDVLFEKLQARAGDTVRQIASDMVTIPSGSIELPGGEDAHHPPVGVSGFQLGRFEVTQAQWRALMVEDPSRFGGCDHCPVEKVSWPEVQKFIDRLNWVSGEHYRLPTEVEWEYACRGGSDDAYCGGDDVGAVAWYAANSGGRTQKVGGKAPNGYGLYDMSGNVQEWLQDCWVAEHAALPGGRDNMHKGECEKYAARGGYWGVNEWYQRTTTREWGYTGARGDYLGFRLAR